MTDPFYGRRVAARESAERQQEGRDERERSSQSGLSEFDEGLASLGYLRRSLRRIPPAIARTRIAPMIHGHGEDFDGSAWTTGKGEVPDLGR